MKKTFCTVLSLLFCIILYLCLIPTAFADEIGEMPQGFESVSTSLYGQNGLLPGDAGHSTFLVSDNASFENAVFTGITLPKDTQIIDAAAFMDCQNMTSVWIPVSVTSIGDGAFDSCLRLRDVYYEGTPAQWGMLSIGASNEPLLDASFYFGNGERRLPITERFFPDPIFRNYIAENFDTVNDGVLSAAEIQAVTEIRCYRMGISSVQGIEFFPELTYLDCGFNALTELDVRSNLKLQTLGIASNGITGLDLSCNPNLQTLSCGVELQGDDGVWNTYGNPLGQLDVTHNSALRYLECPSCDLSELDVSKNPNLEVLSCWTNNLSSLSLSDNSGLLRLACSSNPITELDLTSNPNLEWLVFQHCDVSTLKLGAKPYLQVLRGANANLTAELDVSNCTALQRLECPHNQLTSINVSGCTSLKCLNCCYNQIFSLNTAGCSALEFVDLGANQLSSAAFAGMTKLQYLCLAENQIENLNMSGCSALIELRLSKTEIKNLTLTGCSSLQYLLCWRNQITNLDLSQNTALKHVNLSANMTLTGVTLGSQQNLEMLWVQNTNLTSINIQNCPIIAQAYKQGEMYDFGREGLQRDNGNWVGYKYGDDLNPGSSSLLDHCQFCVDKGVNVIT